MNERENISSKATLVDDEIDLVELTRTVWARRVFITKVISGFALFGLIIAFTSKVEYESTAKLLPESQESSIPDLGGMAGLAGLAGFDLSAITGAGGGGITPELFPEIVSSEPFLRSVINEPVYFEKLDTTITSFDYFKNMDKPSLFGYLAEYTIGLPGKIKEAIAGEDEVAYDKLEGIVRYSKKDWKIVEDFSDRLNVEVEELTGVIYIEVEFPDPVAASQVAVMVTDRLTQYVTTYKLDKSMKNLEFVQTQFDEAKKRYETEQQKVALFTRRNRNVSDPVVEAEYNGRLNEMNMAFEIYRSLATQLEQTKITVAEETPVFTVLEPVRVPEDKSWPRRGLIIFGAIFIGTVFSLTTAILFKNIV